jgi:esterase/lipase superfamily enzyme
VRVEERLWFSRSLGHDMAYRAYGHDGRPVLAFPSQNGRYWDWEAFGMIDALAPMLEEGRLRLFTADGVDWQSWTNGDVGPGDRARRQEDYDRYVADELVPAVLDEAGAEKLVVAGCSMGAFHAANTFFRHPDPIDGLVAVSGLFQPRLFIGDYVDDSVYFQSPLYYLPGMRDPWYLDRYRRSAIVFCIGQGRWEESCLDDHRAMERVLSELDVPATFDYWGHDVDHDWPWWRRMVPHSLERLV